LDCSVAAHHLLEVCQCWDGASITVVDRLLAHGPFEHVHRQHVAWQQQQQQQKQQKQQQALAGTCGIGYVTCFLAVSLVCSNNLAKSALMVTTGICTSLRVSTRAEHVFCVATQRLLGGICSAFPRSDCYTQKWLAHGYTPNTCLWMLWHVTRS
jgi:hypothetical protein